MERGPWTADADAGQTVCDRMPRGRGHHALPRRARPWHNVDVDAFGNPTRQVGTMTFKRDVCNDGHLGVRGYL